MAGFQEDQPRRFILTLWLTSIILTTFSAVFLDWINRSR